MSNLGAGKDSDRDAILAMLNWYRQMGVDDVVGDTAIDWLARGDEPPLSARRLVPAGESAVAQRAGPAAAQRTGQADGVVAPPSQLWPAAAAPTSSPSPSPATQRQFSATPPGEAEADAREAARAATTITALGEALARFDGCGLKATAKNLCFFRGAEKARVMVIGEAPGRDEDQSGVPFVGRAGQLLDKMLAAISLDEKQVHITNVVYWRPPGNRTPTPQEVLVCRPFLDRQIALVEPEIIITVGGPAAKAILDVAQGIMKTRGRWGAFDIANERSVEVMPTLHPAYLLRTPAAKRLAWRDLLAVRAKLDGVS